MIKRSILLTGGGSGGHIYPLIAVAQGLRRVAVDMNNEIELRYFGPRDIFSFYIIGEDIPLASVMNVKWRRYVSLLNIVDALKLPFAILEALWKVFWFMPDVAFSKGGPATLPVLFACRFFRIPIIIHESDAVVSATNRVAARWATRIETGFASAMDAFKRIAPRAIITVTGNPVRESVLHTPAGFTQFFPLPVAVAGEKIKPVLLVIGGSQGSVRINDFIFTNLHALLANYRIIHQVGNSNYQRYLDALMELYGTADKKLPDGYFVTAYLENYLAAAYAAADIVVARASAGIIFESAALGKPAILIPLPEAAQDHQRANAYEYAKTGAAIVVEHENLLINLFLIELDMLFTAPGKLTAMAEAARRFYRPDATRCIVKDILATVDN